MRRSTSCLSILLLVLAISLPAWPACLSELPEWVNLFANPGDTVMLVQRQGPGVEGLKVSGWLLQGQSLGDSKTLGRLRLNCKLSVDEWKKLPLSKQLCSGTTIKKADGGQCRIMDAVPDKKPLDPAKFDSVFVRRIPR